MALKQLNTGYYIKIDLTGNVIVYKTPKSRSLEKSAPKVEAVKNRYLAILNTFYQDKERLYYDPKFSRLFSEWKAEFQRYTQSHYQGRRIGTFPLMSSYIPNIENTLPTIIRTGKVRVKGTTLKEVYDYVKTYKFFGEVKDC
jgi:hypothetical protein